MRSLPIRTLQSRLLLGDQCGGIPLPDWFAKSYAEFRERITDPKYPCYFGSAAERQGDLFYTYVNDGEWTQVPETLAHFLASARKEPQRRQVLTLFVRPEVGTRSHQFYARKFWALLQFLHEHDPQQWPHGLTRDPGNPLWEFVFAGCPMFVFATVPSHRRRKSRNLGQSMAILFQPRTVFAGIEGNTPAGTTARAIIRDRLAQWDDVPPHEYLGSFGDTSNREWKQYFLPDNDGRGPRECPINVTNLEHS